MTASDPDADAVASVAEVMDGLGLWWAVAGGWAIDLWLGEQTRDHHDIEVVVRRCDQADVRDRLGERWELRCLDPPGSGWRPWTGPVEAPAFQLQARCDDIVFDVFTEDVVTETIDPATWHFRRDGRVTRPLADVTVRSGAGIPVVRPEIQLLYMAKAMEPKNVGDFESAAPRLAHDAASWLADALATALPGHPWLAALR